MYHVFSAAHMTFDPWAQSIRWLLLSSSSPVPLPPCLHYQPNKYGHYPTFFSAVGLRQNGRQPSYSADTFPARSPVITQQPDQQVGLALGLSLLAEHGASGGRVSLLPQCQPCPLIRGRARSAPPVSSSSGVHLIPPVSAQPCPSPVTPSTRNSTSSTRPTKTPSTSGNCLMLKRTDSANSGETSQQGAPWVSGGGQWARCQLQCPLIQWRHQTSPTLPASLLSLDESPVREEGSLAEGSTALG